MIDNDVNGERMSKQKVRDNQSINNRSLVKVMDQMLRYNNQKSRRNEVGIFSLDRGEKHKMSN